jgi:membrane-bound ClpP family serine protease
MLAAQAQMFSAQAQNAIAAVRKKHVQELHAKTGRNVIAYYSGYLSKPNVFGMDINDEDKNGFMMAVNKMDRTKGLDLILHTPGGEIAATHSLIDYLHKMFRTAPDAVPDIRAIVPQIAMSAGTMLACSCKEIWMGKHSNLGPIDPQIRGIPAYAVVEEFKKAYKEITSDPKIVPYWQTIIGQYPPAFLNRCEKAIAFSNGFVKRQLKNVMFAGQPTAAKKAAKIVAELSSYAKNKQHDNHIHFDECCRLGLNVVSIEVEDKTPGNAGIQDLILTVHHCYMHTLMNTPAFKIIESQLGVGIQKNMQTPVAK